MVAGSELVVSREATAANTSKYALNGRAATFADVARVFAAKGVDLDNNRFLILQARPPQPRPAPGAPRPAPRTARWAGSARPAPPARPPPHPHPFPSHLSGATLERRRARLSRSR